VSDDIKKQVEARVAEAQARAAADPKKNGKRELPPKFVERCLHANELGDGCLFAFLCEDHFIYSKSAKEWFIWNGQHWERDILERSSVQVEKVAECYLQEVDEIDRLIEELKKQERPTALLQKKREAYMGRIKRLRSDRGRNACLRMSHTNEDNSLALVGDEFDKQPYLLPCQNGVIDLRTGELRSGRPSELLLKASPIEFKGIKDACPDWEKSIDDIFLGNADMVAFVQRLLGYALIGEVREHILPVFWGQGRNGKGTILEVLHSVLGELASPIQSELLLDQGRAKSSSGPSPDVMALRGLRLAFASESDENRRFSPSKVKWLSGGDTLVGRHPHDKYETTFRPTHTLFLMTNNRPNAPSDDFAFWERVLLIEFQVSFVRREPRAENERPADPDLRLKLAAEYPGILAWLVRGCLAYQEQGLAPPPAVKAATAAYRRNEDRIQDWIDDRCYLHPGVKTGSSDLFDNFRQWYETNVSKMHAMSQKKWGKLMSVKFEKKKEGTVIYEGIGLLDLGAADHRGG
jgi:putative DNA primase/helicase